MNTETKPYWEDATEWDEFSEDSLTAEEMQEYIDKNHHDEHADCKH